MRRLVTLIAGIALLTLSAPAVAQDGGGGGGGGEGGDQRSKFYDFGDMVVDGELKTPEVQRADGRGDAKFDRLLDLKKSFLSKIQESTEEEALE